VFRYGIAFEPIENASQRLTTSLEANQPPTTRNRSRPGSSGCGSAGWRCAAANNFNADALKLSAGAGINAELGGWKGTLDYA